MSLRADGVLLVEVDGERVAGVRAAFAGVAGGVPADRRDQADPVSAAGKQIRGGGVAGVHEVLGR